MRVHDYTAEVTARTVLLKLITQSPKHYLLIHRSLPLDTVKMCIAAIAIVAESKGRHCMLHVVVQKQSGCKLTQTAEVCAVTCNCLHMHIVHA